MGGVLFGLPGTLTLALAPILTRTSTRTPNPTLPLSRYSEDYIRKHSAYDAYIAGVRKAARQGKTPPQRKKPAPEVTVAAVEEEDDDDDEQVLLPPPHPAPPPAVYLLPGPVRSPAVTRAALALH